MLKYFAKIIYLEGPGIIMSAFSLQKCRGSYNRVIMSKVLGLAFLLSLLLSAQLQIQTYAATPGDDQRLTEQEVWVLRQIQRGMVADLKTGFGGDGKKSRLQAGFLEKLLSGGFNKVKIPRQGVQIANAIIDGPLNLKYTEVDVPLGLSHCLFQDQVIFQESNFKKDLSFIGSKFLKSANFKGMKTGGSVFCDHAFFMGESLWCDAKIGEKFHAERAEFQSKTAKADFNGLRVGTSANFISARFSGPVDFGAVNIGRHLNINKAEFLNDQETADFSDMKVDQIAYCKEVRFHGPVSFVIAQVGIQFFADRAEFLNPAKQANFSGIKVGNTIYFRKTKFHGPVKFEFADIGVNFRATGAELLNNRQAKNFSKMKIGHKVFLDGVTICSQVDMSYGEFYDLEIQGTIKDKKAEDGRSIYLSKLNLKGTLVKRELRIANARIGELDVSHMQVKGPALFNDVEIETLADFRDATFQGLDFQKVKWPAKEKGKDTRKVYLGELTYNSISTDKPGKNDYSQKDFEEIKKLIEASPFTTQSYIQLEAFFKRIGKESWANEVYIRMHDRELAEKMRWWDPRRWLEWFFWGKLAGYGRAPFRVFFISLALITLGAFLFDPEHLTVHKKSAARKSYKSVVIRFFISLDRFLPIELGLAKNWDPTASHFFIYFYFHFQHIIGWILIPIALASIYTQIR